MSDFEKGFSVGLILAGKNSRSEAGTIRIKKKGEVGKVLNGLDSLESLASITLPDNWEIHIKRSFEMGNVKYNRSILPTDYDDIQTAEFGDGSLRSIYSGILIWFCFYKNSEMRYATYINWTDNISVGESIEYVYDNSITSYVTGTRLLKNLVIENFVITSLSNIKFDYTFQMEATAYNSDGEITEQHIENTYSGTGVDCREQVYYLYTTDAYYTDLDTFLTDNAELRYAIDKYLGLTA